MNNHKNQSCTTNGSTYVYKAIIVLIMCVFLLTIMEGLSMYRNSACYVHTVQDGQTSHYEPLKVSIVRKRQQMTDENNSQDNSSDKERVLLISEQGTTTENQKQVTTTTHTVTEAEIVIKNIGPTTSGPTFKGDTQVERQRRLREFCKKSDHLLEEKFSPRNPNMLISDKSSTIYCYVPKVACTNWKRVYQVLEGNIKDPLDIKRKEQVHLLKYTSFKDYKTPSEIRWRQNLYYSFMFVRHPFERVLSAYRNKLQDPYNHQYQRVYGSAILRMVRKGLTEKQYNAGMNVTFPEFVEYIINTYNEKGYKYLNEHWQIMHKLCHPCNIKYNFIGKMDSLVEDSARILREIGWGDKVKFPANAKDKYKNDLKALMKEYYSKLSKEMIQELYEIYEDDFKAFGYDVKDYLN